MSTPASHPSGADRPLQPRQPRRRSVRLLQHQHPRRLPHRGSIRRGVRPSRPAAMPRPANPLRTQKIEAKPSAMIRRRSRRRHEQLHQRMNAHRTMLHLQRPPQRLPLTPRTHLEINRSAIPLHRVVEPAKIRPQKPLATLPRRPSGRVKPRRRFHLTPLSKRDFPLGGVGGGLDTARGLGRPPPGQGLHPTRHSHFGVPDGTWASWRFVPCVAVGPDDGHSSRPPIDSLSCSSVETKGN